MSPIGEISTYESGVDVIVEWKIKNFSTLSEKDGARYLSPSFSFGGERWFLRILPNGSSRHDSYGHVGLSLCKCNSDRSIKQSFSLSIKTVTGETYNEEHFTKDFGKISENCHDLLRFIPSSELSRRQSKLVPHGVLTIVYTMKNMTSAASSSNSASAEICSSDSDSGSAECFYDSGECCHCKGNFATGSLSPHQRKCMQRPIKCPDCLEVVMLQKWFNEHECQQERPEGEVCASVSSASPYEKKVLHDFKELFLQKEDCDVTIKVKGSEIRAHRLILKVRSPVFASTFRHDMKESATGIVEIEDCDPSPFSDFLYFLYCGDIGMISIENVFSLFSLADKYEVLDLKAKCLDFIKKNMTIDTFCETITLALQHSETELIALATDLFVENAEEILETVKWQTFAAENPTQSNELFIKFVKSVKRSNT